MDQDYKTAVEWLEKLQAETYSALGIDRDYNLLPDAKFQNDFLQRMYDNLYTEKSDISFEAFSKNMEKELTQASTALLTPYENPGWYSLITGFSKEIEVSMSRLGHTLRNKPLFGTLPTGRMNGQAIALGNSASRIILLEDGLFGFANLVAKSVAHTFPLGESVGDKLTLTTEDSGWRERIRTHPQLTERFFDLIAAYLVAGRPHAAKPYLPDPKYESFGSFLRNCFEIFVLGHEYGHCIAGHLDTTNTKEDAAKDDDESDQIVTNWKQEFEADALGLSLMMDVMGQRGYSPTMAFAGGVLFFDSIDIVQRAESVLRYGRLPTEEEMASQTHPPPSMRREMLSEGILRAVSRDVAEAAIDLANTIQRVIKYHWSVCEPVFMRMHKDRVPLAALWAARP